MKDKIQSYVGMRGACGWLNDPLITHLSPTNHPLKHGIGKYIFSLLLVLTMSIGQMWGELTAHTPGVYEKTTDKGGYGCTLTTVASGANAGTFEVYYFSAQSKYSENTTVYNGGTKQQYRLMCTDSDSEYQLINTNGTSAFTASCDWIEMAYTTTGFSKSDYTFGTNKFNEFFEITPNGGNTGITKTCYIKPKEGDVLTLKVSGYVEFTILGNDNGSSKYMTITVDGGTPTSWKSSTLSRRSVELTTGEHTIVVACVGNSANAFYGFSLKLPSCDDANASIIANTSVYVNDELDLEFSSDNTNSVVYDIKKGGSATSDASVTAGVFKATVAGTYVVTATQAKDASDHCAVEESVTITVNSKTPVSSVSISGDATAYIGIAKTLTATADQAVDEYKWEVDGVDQGVNAASFDFSAAAAGTYSVVCKARNSFNDPGEYIASSAHSITVTKLCGTLVSFTVSGGTSAADLSGILSASATPEVSLSAGSSSKLTVDEVEYTGYKMDKGKYVGVTLTSGSFKAGDVVSFMITTASNMGGGSALYLYDTKTGSNQIATLASSSTGWTDFVLTSATTGVYLYRSNPDNEYPQNPYVAAVKVTRSCETSTDCEIKSLTINGESITPVGKVYSYEVAAASALTEVAVAYTIHPLATGSPASGFNVTVPAAGDPANTQTITVTAEDGTHSDTYTVSVTKAASASDVVTLDALGVTGYTLDPAFDAGTLAYTITKAYGAEDPGTDKVTYTKTETEQTVDVAYDGTNHKLTITVTAEDNTTTQDYEITINEAEAPKSLSRVLFSNGFDAFIDNANHTVKAYYLAGQAAPTATTITAGNGTAGEYAEGKITVTGDDASAVDYIVTLEAVTPNTTSVAEADPAGEFAGDEAWVKNGLLVYGNAAGYSAGDKWYVNRRLTKSGDAADDQRVIAGWVRSYFFVGNASKFIMTVGGNNALKYAIDGGEQVANASGTLEISLTKGNHMIEVVSNQSNGDCRLSAPKLVELPPTFSVTYMPNGGTGAEYIVDDDASEVAAGSIFTAPASSIFAGWNTQDDGNGVAYAAGDAVTEDLVLYAQWSSYFTITYMDGETQLDTEDVLEGDAPVGIADPVKFGYDFAGWTLSGSDEVIDVTELSASTTVYAKWIAFDGCTLFYPATSGSTIAVGDEIASQTGSFGATMVAVSKDESCTLAYESYGLSFASSGNTSRVKVTLDHDIAIGTKITVTLVANGDKGSNRALDLYNSAVAKKAMLGWTSSDDYLKYDVATFSHTVTAEDAMAGTNEFYLYRNNSVYLQCLKVETCGDPIVFHNLTSAVDPADKGTVTLGATSVREGYTTTAEYSAIDPLYEFVSWSVSGAGASVENATANPATITMGTEDAIVTLNLQLIPEKFTVNYYDGATPMGTEDVELNANPTASTIDTDKRHYTFQGWSETDGGSVVALNTITSDVVATINLFAVYAPVACPTSGYLFSLESDEAKRPAEKVKAAKNGGEVDLADYATISGGAARIINDETGSDKDAVGTDGKFLLTATKEVMKIELNCVLQEGDIIRIPDNNQKYVLSTTNAKSGTYQAQTSSQHEFAVTADWAGVDDIYVLYDGSSLNFTKVYVYRPALFTVSFNLKGHGSAVADIENVLEGSKITAPAAPTDEDFAFAGWYKENTLENEWDFDNDVVSANTTLFAKWLDKSDATLKSLKYGTTDIELEDGVYEYEIALAAATASVPALTAVTNNPAANAAITNAAAFDGEGKATSTVEVTPQKEGAAHLTYTVKFSKLAALPQVNVTGSTTWNFSAGGSTSLTNQSDVVLANLPGINNDENFNSQALLGSFNKMEGTYFQGSKLSFTTEVPGKLTITFRGTNGNTRHLQACVGDGETVVADWVYNSSSTSQTKTIFVPEGKVTLKAFEGETPNNARIYQMIFNATPDYTRDVTEGRYGTICLPQAGVMVGAAIFELAYYSESDNKIFMDQVMSGEMVAGRPYVFLPKEGISTLGVYYTDDEAVAAGDYRGLYGYYNGTDDALQLNPGDGHYILYNNQFREVTVSHVWIDQNRAYFKIGVTGGIPTNVVAPLPGRRRMSIGAAAPQVTTGMDELNAGEAPVKVLINGELFILRGDKMFDATGRLIK